MRIRYLLSFLLSFLFSFGPAISSADEMDPYGKVYTQCLPSECFEEGVASYHFDSSDAVWINWQKFNFTVDSVPIKKKYFEDIEFDTATRTFKGKLIFERSLDQRPYRGVSAWEYRMVFDEDFQKINDGALVVRYRFGKAIDEIAYGEDWYYVLSGSQPSNSREEASR